MVPPFRASWQTVIRPSTSFPPRPLFVPYGEFSSSTAGSQPCPRPAAGAPPLPPRLHFFSILLNSAVDIHTVGLCIVPVDIRHATRENAPMQVTLTRDLEDFIAQKVRGGGYANPGEVVREALRDFRTKDDPAEVDSRELAELLLPAVRGRHRPLTPRHFGQLRLRARRKPVRS